MTFSGNSTPMLRVIKLHSCMQGLVSIAMGHNVSSLLPIVLHLSQFLPICGLSYEGLITGHDVDKFTTICGGKYGHPYFLLYVYGTDPFVGSGGRY